MTRMRICVFCGSTSGRRPEFAAAARALGAEMARRGIGLVNGGGHVGLMGAVADGVLAAGGEAIGVIPRALMDRELGHRGMTELRVVETMHERKELFEAWTWSGLGIHRKPVGVLDVAGYWEPLLAMGERMVAEGFLPQHLQTSLLVAREPGELLSAMIRYEPPRTRWAASGVKP